MEVTKPTSDGAPSNGNSGGGNNGDGGGKVLSNNINSGGNNSNSSGDIPNNSNGGGNTPKNSNSGGDASNDNSANKRTMETCAILDPPAMEIPASGGVSTHQLKSGWDNRLAFKIKCSDNDHYRVNAVYGILEPGASTPIEVTRTVGVVGLLLQSLPASDFHYLSLFFLGRPAEGGHPDDPADRGGS